MIVTGKVVDEGGDGIPASVFLSSKDGNMFTPTNGVNANADGSFTLNVPANTFANPFIFLTAQFVGTTKQTKPLAANVNFKLVTSGELAEVEVTANKIKRPKILPYLILLGLVSTAGYFWYKHTHTVA